MDLTNAVVYDVETLPNVFTLTMEMLNSDVRCTWEISHYRDDRRELIAWFNYLEQTQTPMIGFFSLKFDYPVIDFILRNPNCTVEDIHRKSRELAKTFDGWHNIIWDRDRFAPQIDLFHIHHFDNKAKRTDLKSLQINMRSQTVVDSPLPFDQPVSAPHVDQHLIPYNVHDVTETKKFAHISMDAIKFRIALIGEFGIEVINYNDVKIGAKMFEKHLGDDVCYDRSSGRKQKRQTPRHRIALNEIIFPYIQFSNPEFNRVLDFMKGQVLTPDDLDDPDAPIKTKGVFTGLNANVGGLTFEFGTGGVHASVKGQRFEAGGGWLIRDIDVEALYPSIAIENRLAPEHLGDAFRQTYPIIKAERKKHAKGTYENGALKLANNGPWGQSNNKFSVFFDPKYAMTIPINGQLMLCMLAEWLVTVPTLTLIQANTDGITYRIHESMEPHAAAICRQWEEFTRLKLEDANYNRMWIRDVNNYVAEDTKGKLKQKGAYWHPDPLNYHESIGKASPPCWYKDLGNIVSIRAAITAMVHGVDPEAFIRCHTDPFDFMCRIKVGKADVLTLGGVPIQRTTRYYVTTDGQSMMKISPPAGPPGAFKRASKVSEADYNRRMAETGGAWCETVCTKNRSTYEQRETAIEAGWKVTECNDARSFRFDNINIAWYVNEAKKLIIA